MKLTRLVLAVAAMMLPMAAQSNSYLIYDGTTESTSRGGTPGTNAAGILVRYPANQYLGALGVVGATYILQDQDFRTADPCTFVVRGHDQLGPTSGQPDITPTGILASAGPFNLTFPTPASGIVSAAYWTVTFGTAAAPVRVPATTNPGNPPMFEGLDMYVGVELGANITAGVAWPNDGISQHNSQTIAPTNPGEQMSTLTAGYTTLPGVAGLGWRWDVTTAGSPPLLASGNRAWWTNTQFAGDILRTNAYNAGAFTGSASGVNPNYGYAGMFPDMNRQVGGVTASDGVGFRVHATAAQGSPVYLFISSGIMPPIALGGVNGELALDITSPAFGEIFSSLPALPLAVTGPTGTPPGLAYATTTSEANFGPLPGDPLLVGLGALSFQAVTVDALTNVLTISSVTTLKL